VDKGAEEIIVKGLEKILPEAGFITEEGTKKEAGRKFYLDS
jgi:myo-inositol-1(or 4)-monophosphatase